MTKGNVWTKVLDRLEMKLKRHDFIAWLMPTSLAVDNGETIEVRVADQNRVNWIRKQYLEDIQAALAEEGRANTRVDLVVGPAVSSSTNGGRRKGMQGRDIDFPACEPWDDPVDGAELLAEIARACERFVTLPPYASTALALWTLHTYAHDAFFCSPYLAITSPMKQCGKSTLLNGVLASLVYRGQPLSNMTGAVLFRIIDAYQPTLLIDEADTFLPENEQLRGLLNAGHMKKGAWLLRNIGDDYLPRKFSTWCPKAIAAIGRLPSTLEDRSIHIRMRRQREGEQGYRAERLREDLIEAWHLPIRRRAQRWADDNVERFRNADPEMPAALTNRPADCWRPLLTIADAAGGEWPMRARAAAEALSGNTFSDEQEISVELLRDLAELMAQDSEDRTPVLNPDAGGVITSADIVKALASLPDRPWSAWRGDKPLSPYALSKLLRGLQIYPAAIRRRGEDLTSRGYRSDAFTDAFSRYLPEWLIGCNKLNVYGPKSPINHSENGVEKIVVDRAKSPVNIDERSPDQPLSGKTGKRGVIPLLPNLSRQVARAHLQSVPTPRHHSRTAAKGKVN